MIYNISLKLPYIYTYKNKYTHSHTQTHTHIYIYIYVYIYLYVYIYECYWIIVGKLMIKMVFLKNIMKSSNLVVTFSDLLERLFWNSFLKTKVGKDFKKWLWNIRKFLYQI